VKLLFATIIWLSSGISWALYPLNSAANFLCEQIQTNPQFKYEDHFSSTFIQKIPYQTITQILGQIFVDDGSCKSVTINPKTENSAKIRFLTNTTSQKFILSVDGAGLIAGLQYVGRSEPKIQIKNDSDLTTSLDKFDGVKSLYLKDLDSNNVLLNINSAESLALGSEFKLYILKALAEDIANGFKKWDDKIKIQENLKSLPSGILQDAPVGTELTLLETAGLMISRSDNTATDHLHALVGHRKIEMSMVDFNSFLEFNKPFLSTMEMFRLRTLSQTEVDNYLNFSLEKKILFNESLSKQYTRQQLTEALKGWTEPRNIRQIEWFASTSDICKTVSELKHKAVQDSTIYNILSISNPFIWTEDDPEFEYVGYKGGSEPGVLTMTFLLKTRNQKWACLSMGINNENANLDENAVADLFHAILNYSATKLRGPNGK
jgi:beta-lactamase class A